MSPSSQNSTKKNGTLTSRIVDWDDQKGFGFLLHNKSKLFLHRKDFAERHKRPSKGDKIQYRVGSDPKGRPCAVGATHVNDGGKITILTWLGLLILIIIPAVAINSLVIDYHILPLYVILPLICINVITYQTYKSDKHKARAKMWRTPETTLHFLEFIGGWPSALLAQRQYRHKCSKPGFQAIYWLIVVIHNYLAIDYILGWKLFRSIQSFMAT